MKKIMVLVFLTLFGTNVYAVDVDFNKMTIAGKPFGTSIKPLLLAKKLNIDAERKYPTIGFDYEPNDYEPSATGFLTPWHYSFFFVDWDPDNPQEVPKHFKASPISFSHGFKQHANFIDVIKQIRKSNFDYVAYAGNWCFYSGSCDVPGKLIAFKLSDKWYVTAGFVENKLVDLDVYGEDNGYLECIRRESVKKMKLIESRGEM